MPRRARTIQAKRRISPGFLPLHTGGQQSYRSEQRGGPGKTGVNALSIAEKMQ
jgi:hypothetical protein